MKKYYLALLLGLQVFHAMPVQIRVKTPVANALTLGGAAWVAKKLLWDRYQLKQKMYDQYQRAYNWYQQKQNQKEKELLIDRILEGLQRNPRINTNDMRAILDFLGINAISRDEVDSALQRYRKRHSNTPYPLNLLAKLFTLVDRIQGHPVVLPAAE